MGIISGYIKLLKNYPLSTNIGTAAIVMTTGDAMAQNLERAHWENALMVDVDPEMEKLSVKRKINLNRYSTRLALEEEEKKKKKVLLKKEEEERRKQRRRLVVASSSSTTTAMEEEEEEEETRLRPPSTLSYDGHETSPLWEEGMNGLLSVISDLDHNRSLSMMGWSVFLYTPAYMLLYRACDRVWPQRTPFTVLCRVMSSLVYSIPVNALFFTYGTCIHHVIDWSDRRKDDEGEEATSAALPLESLDFGRMMTDSKLKIEAELAKTVERSALMWIPINAVNFTVVPTHLRPLVLMFFSVFWNCYLSLVQHQDMKMPEGYVEEYHLVVDDDEEKEHSSSSSLMKKRTLIAETSMVSLRGLRERIGTQIMSTSARISRRLSDDDPEPPSGGCVLDTKDGDGTQNDDRP